MYSIYKLINPLNGLPFYIGCTRQPLHKRLSGHYSTYREWRRRFYPDKIDKNPFARYILMSEICDSGEVVTIEFITSVDEDKADELEKYYYSYYLSIGVKLLQSKYHFSGAKSDYNLKRKRILESTLVDANSVTKGVVGRPKSDKKSST